MSVWLSWDEINTATQGKKLIFWGSGPMVEKAHKYLAGEIAYVVDSDPFAQKTTGIDAPTTLLEERPAEVFIVITTSGFTDVIMQLESYGFIAGKHFCVSPTLQDFEVLSRIQSHTQTIYLTCPDPFNNKGGLYRLNTPSGKVEKLLDGPCHGLVEGKDGICLVDDTACGIRILNHAFETMQTVLLPEDSRPHGIAYSEERDWIAVALTGCDAIGIYDAGGARIVKIPLSDKYRNGGLPEHNINDLCFWRGRLYVTMFSTSGNWKRGIYDGAVLEFDLNDPLRVPSVVVADLWLPHTPVIIRDTLHFCESMKGRVWAGNRKLIVEFHGFVRGIAHDGDFYYVGQSQHRYITRRLGAVNISLDTGVFLVDDKTKATKFFATPRLMDINSIMVSRGQVP